MTEEKVKALDYIESIVISMRECSFKCKEFCIIICSAFLTIFGTVQPTPKIMILLCSPVILMFWIIDAFYLYKERLFRDEYKRIASNSYSEKDVSPLLFSAKLNSRRLSFCKYLRAMFKSVSTTFVYSLLLCSSLVFGILLLVGVL